MALARSRRSQRHIDYWPGFVDALSVMLLVITFLLSVFMLSQFFMSREVSGKDSALGRLNRQIEELTSLLALERSKSSSDQSSLASLQATLDATAKERNRLQGVVDAGVLAGGGAAVATSDAAGAVTREKDNTSRALAQVDILNQQIAALRKQLGALEDALGASESRDKDSQARIAELGSRLNVALAQKVQELARYRSDFFGRLREILGNRPGIRVVGDRFVFQSEVLFDSGQATVNPDGHAELDQLASAVIELEREIPPDIAWILRVDGHTDKRPITSPQFKSNWDLSASRAIAVVQYLVGKGVDPQRLLAAGFGEFQPIDTGDSDDALRRNRRIELKLTER
ncbi:peptidoglycan -binding protein [Lichenihabitans sp. Uapishka_5]|uniref:peptidoglycan -binding protein n=1 Tax=Lichenihabitans sp. Uapishka_5 TaxID=3037302 RepID=UPI0029E7FFD2|nr:peptidoglycan -binding protein [Lichenihabitans sp. Uapishka_5]MDX7949920.1 peptidoglycan -binding protein [Lichenihabitans sp. Uapishka_5]